MDFVIKLPVNYTLDFTEKIVREETFHLAFKSLIFKYAGHEVPYDISSVFNIEYDDNANYFRLKTISPQYPKEMQDDIVESLVRVFVTNASYQVH